MPHPYNLKMGIQKTFAAPNSKINVLYFTNTILANVNFTWALYVIPDRSQAKKISLLWKEYSEMLSK